MKYQDYYKVLGVERSADAGEVKGAYRRLARKYHPDVSHEPDAEARFKEIGEAYEVLKDPDKRAAYDNLGAQWQAGQDFTPPPGWDGAFNLNQAFGGSSFDFSDFFDSLFGGHPSVPHSARGSRSGPRGRSPDDRATIRLRLEDAYLGAEPSLKVQVPTVDQFGRRVTRTRTLKVKVPAGITEGQQIRLAGQGQAGRGNRPDGNLYLEVVFQPHRRFRVDGRDVHLELPITPWEAALGADVTVATLDSPVTMKVPAGSQSGRKLRLKGRGLGRSPKGNQYVELRIVTPAADSEDAKAFYRRMAAELPFDPRSDS